MNYIPGLRYTAGYIQIMGPDGLVEMETYECCHHNGHFVREIRQGPPAICLMCMQPTCGSKPCDVCIPFEAKLEAWEGTRRFWKQLEIGGK